MRIPLQPLQVAVLALALAACNGGGGYDDVAGGATRSPARCTAVAPAAQPAMLAADGRPLTIPALREWQAATGTFQLCNESRILIAPADQAGLFPVAQVLAEDFAEQTGRAMAVVIAAPATANPGDISMSLGETDSRLGAEGYRMTVGNAIALKAIQPAGAFYGTRSVLQLLRQDSRIPAGEAIDWPRYPERGLMIDAGRKYFPATWIRRHIRELAWLKLNYFHLHFSDNLGFRVESSTHPEIVSEEHLTKQEVREIVALAARHYITVVPEIDMPGHMDAALAPHPELQLVDILGRASPGRLDVTKPEAETFARELIEEYVPLFSGRYWHMGADEYMAPYEYPLHPQLQTFARQRYGANANGKDAIHGFTNWMDALLRSHGKVTRMWHDDLNGGSAVTINPEIIVEWWTNFSPLSDPLPPAPQALLNQGHAIMNAGWWPTYYTLGVGIPGVPVPVPLPPRVDFKDVYETWEVHEFYGPLFLNGTVQFPAETIAADEPRNLGSKLHVWCDDPEAETLEEIAEGIAPRLRVIAQKTWESPLLVPAHADFETVMGATGHAPGYQE